MGTGSSRVETVANRHPVSEKDEVELAFFERGRDLDIIVESEIIGIAIRISPIRVTVNHGPCDQ